jgi:hypothetical protein
MCGVRRQCVWIAGAIVLGGLILGVLRGQTSTTSASPQPPAPAARGCCRCEFVPEAAQPSGASQPAVFMTGMSTEVPAAEDSWQGDASPAEAAEGDASRNALPTEWQDPGFSRYLDVSLLATAWSELDPSLLTDAALQMAEGERILLRPHKAISVHSVLQKAIQIAAGKKDKGALDRLARVAAQRDNAALKSQVAAAQKLAGTVRATDPGLMVAVDQMTPDAFAAFQAVVKAIQDARITGNIEVLAQLEESVKTIEGLPQIQQEYLRKLLGQTRAELPKDGQTDTSAKLLDKLTASSRDTNMCPKCTGYGRYWRQNGWTGGWVGCDRCNGTGRVHDYLSDIYYNVVNFYNDTPDNITLYVQGSAYRLGPKQWGHHVETYRGGIKPPAWLKIRYLRHAGGKWDEVTVPASQVKGVVSGGLQGSSIRYSVRYYYRWDGKSGGYTHWAILDEGGRRF